jgi:hypothetical protein
MKRYKSLFKEEFPLNYKQGMFLKNIIEEYLIDIGKEEKRKEAFTIILHAISNHKLDFDKDKILLFLQKKYN